MRTKIKSQTVSIISIAIAVLSLLFAVTVRAGTGSTDSSALPGSTNSYTLEDIYNRLNAGAAGTQSTFTEPSVAPGTGTMHTLDDIMSVAPALDNASGATTSDVANGKTFWGLTSGAWSLQTGTSSGGGGGSATLPRTGQTVSYATGDDGDLQMGVAWPNPRFTDHGDGTVTDNLSGLIWLKNASCPIAHRIWSDALSDVTQLNTDGTMNGSGCSDTSNGGSHQTDWRLPNVRELHSLIDFSQSTGPLLPSDHPFVNVQTNCYWSSTTYASDTSDAWRVSLSIYGGVGNLSKSTGCSVWAVRDGQ